MSKKLSLIIVFAAIAAVAVFAAESLREREARLTEKRRQLEIEMYQLRIELIRQDPELAAMHQRIMMLHKELQLMIDRKPAMRKLIREAAEIDTEIKALEKKADTN